MTYHVTRSTAGLAVALVRYDYIDRVFTEHPIIDDIYGHEVMMKHFCLNPTGTRIYFKAGVGGSPEYEMIGAFDLTTNQLDWYKLLRGPCGGIEVSPDDREVYANEVGERGLNFGVLFVLDAQTGAQLHAYSSYGYDENRLSATRYDQAVFTPAGDKLYVGGGALHTGGGMLALFDPKERELIKFITPDFHRSIHWMAIGPKL